MIQNFRGRHGQNWVWPDCLQNSKIDPSSTINRRINQFFACYFKFRKVETGLTVMYEGFEDT